MQLNTISSLVCGQMKGIMCANIWHNIGRVDSNQIIMYSQFCSLTPASLQATSCLFSCPDIHVCVWGGGGDECLGTRLHCDVGVGLSIGIL